jgi:hypothetical protein
MTSVCGQICVNAASTLAGTTVAKAYQAVSDVNVDSIKQTYNNMSQVFARYTRCTDLGERTKFAGFSNEDLIRELLCRSKTQSYTKLSLSKGLEEVQLPEQNPITSNDLNAIASMLNITVVDTDTKKPSYVAIPTQVLDGRTQTDTKAVILGSFLSSVFASTATGIIQSVEQQYDTKMLPIQEIDKLPDYAQRLIILLAGSVPTAGIAIVGQHVYDKMVANRTAENDKMMPYIACLLDKILEYQMLLNSFNNNERLAVSSTISPEIMELNKERDNLKAVEILLRDEIPFIDAKYENQLEPKQKEFEDLLTRLIESQEPRALIDVKQILPNSSLQTFLNANRLGSDDDINKIFGDIKLSLTRNKTVQNKSELTAMVNRFNNMIRYGVPSNPGNRPPLYKQTPEYLNELQINTEDTNKVYSNIATRTKMLKDKIEESIGIFEDIYKTQMGVLNIPSVTTNDALILVKQSASILVDSANLPNDAKTKNDIKIAEKRMEIQKRFSTQSAACLRKTKQAITEAAYGALKFVGTSIDGLGEISTTCMRSFQRVPNSEEPSVETMERTAIVEDDTAQLMQGTSSSSPDETKKTGLASYWPFGGNKRTRKNKNKRKSTKKSTTYKRKNKNKNKKYSRRFHKTSKK